MKTSELQGAALDWAVATCEGATDFWFDTVATHWVKLHGEDRALRYGWAQSYLPSTDWAQGGPIIEREEIALEPMTHDKFGDGWLATRVEGPAVCMEFGPTMLIAAMRCYVVGILGDEVEVPNEIVS